MAKSKSSPKNAASPKPCSKCATMDQGSQQKIGARFSNPTLPPKKTGTGLGLAVVQQIVLAHGWEIQCLANEPKGAVFRMTHLKVAG